MPVTKLRTFNYDKAKKHGYKTDRKTALVYWLIHRRSKVLIWSKRTGLCVPQEVYEIIRPSCVWIRGKLYYRGVHTERQFSERYRGISISATSMDICNCVRFKKILYSHQTIRWDTVKEEVTCEQEDAMFEKACRMAGLDPNQMGKLFCSDKPIEAGRMWWGQDAIGYDTPGVSFSFITRAKIWVPDKRKVWCTETACEVDRAGQITDLVADEQHPAGYHIKRLEEAAV